MNKLYVCGPDDRREARDHLLVCTGLFAHACAQEIEWENAVYAGIDLRERRRKVNQKLSGDEVEMLAFAHAQLALWKYRRVVADRLLAVAQDLYVYVHRGDVMPERAA